MKILWVKANKLLPVRSGGDIRSYHLARQLGVHHQLTFLSYYDGPADRDYERKLRAEFPGAEAICTGKRDLGALGRGVDYVRRIARSEPYAVSRLVCQAVREKIAVAFAQKRFDVAVCDFLDAAANFPEGPVVPTVLFQHNVESEIWRRYASTERNPLKRAVFGFEFKRMLEYERRAVSRFQSVVAVSEHDRAIMAKWTDASRITVVPTGVDLQQYRPSPRTENGTPLVIYVGAMDWLPNVDAVECFAASIWPAVQAAVPVAKFRIVGRNPGARVQALASDSIEVTGSVPSVVEHLREASVVVVPLRIGGGTRLKIYEAMAMGKAVVSMSVGAEGLDVHHGRDIWLVDDPARFAEAVAVLLKDHDLRRRLEINAAELAAKYDWPVIGQKFAAVLESAAALPSASYALGGRAV